MRVLVFGASTVQGFWDSQGGWADRLKKYYDEIQLKDLSQDIPHVMNLGISNDGSAKLLKRIGAECEARRNQKGLAIIISVGSNSAAILNGQPVASIEQYKDEMEKIVSTAKRYTDKIMLVGLPAVDEPKTTPVSWIDMHFKNDRIAEFEAAAGQLAGEQGIPFVPIHSAMLAEGTNLIAGDGLHPNDYGHQLISKLVQPELGKLLNT
jgi:lysophospholipase L1-like esterase